MTSRARGVDVSSVQAHVDYKKLAAGGYDFLIPKASEGKGTDPYFAQHVTGARGAGMTVPCAYHVLSPSAPLADQLALVRKWSDNYGLHVALDFELRGQLSPGQAIMRALQFATELTADGTIKCLVYSYPYFMSQFQGSSALILLAQTCEYWAASYPHQKTEPTDAEVPVVPKAWGGKWRAWQWSGDGGLPAPGIPQIVDHNLWDGSKADLLQWTNQSDAGAGDTLPDAPSEPPDGTSEPPTEPDANA